MASSSIIYHCRNKYLKSREGGSRKQQRRKSSLDLFGIGNDNVDKPQFSCLDEKVYGPCTPEILVPPSELMTRSRAFRQAYWNHHARPTTLAIEKLDIHQIDERKERLNRKRKDILSKIRSKEAVRRQEDMRRRAERILGGHVRDESDNESDNDSGDDDDQQLGAKMSLLSLSPSEKSTSGSRRMMLSSSGVIPKNHRTINLDGSANQKESLKAEEEDVEEEESVFSFLSEWK